MNAPIETRERPILFSAPMVRAILDGSKTMTRRVVTKPITPNRYTSSVDALHRPDLPADAMLLHAGSGKERRLVGSTEGWERECPYGGIGDRLYVKERWRPEIAHHCIDDACDCASVNVRYAADGATVFYCEEQIGDDWTMPKAAKRGDVPGIFLPRWASRITLEITGVRVQRLQEISTADIWAEGVTIPATEDGKPLLRLTGGYEPHLYSDKPVGDWTEDDWARTHWASLWDSVNAKRIGPLAWKDNPHVFVIAFKRIEAGA